MMKRTVLVVAMLVLIVEGCSLPSSPIPPVTVTVPATLTPLPASTPTPTLACERETASVVLSASATDLKVGDMVKVTVRVNNEGCVALGVPQYRLYTAELGSSDSLFRPANPEPIVNYLAVSPGESDAAEFELQAVASGQAPLTASVSYEVHLGYPGPAYWGLTSTEEPLILTIAP